MVTTEPDDKQLEQMPVLFTRCIQVYNAMAENAQVESLGVEYEDQEGLVYEGFLTALITEDVGLSVPYYTKTTQELKRMDCIRQLRRGGSTTPSRWLLLQEPTRELYLNMNASKSKVSKTSKAAQMEQQIRDLNKRVSTIERQLG